MPSSSHNRARRPISYVKMIPYMEYGVPGGKIAPFGVYFFILRDLEKAASTMSPKQLYKVIFMSRGQIYEIYARGVGHGDMFGFVEVEELVFGERTTLVVDPSEEKIKSEFENVKRTYLPMHAIIRIDEVDKQGISKISKFDGGNVTQFPVPVYTPGDKG